jgi:hypothetical protein
MQSWIDCPGGNGSCRTPRIADSLGIDPIEGAGWFPERTDDPVGAGIDSIICPDDRLRVLSSALSAPPWESSTPSPIKIFNPRILSISIQWLINAMVAIDQLLHEDREEYLY